ncbi:Cutinase [Penicillium angulare]|uniref:cutinase n=1 Tax=Penicillium angulare TaxID=116970 RepID=A0A9W9JZA7_9EURO|nr:Cutinase [Penicillium angulare]
MKTAIILSLVGSALAAPTPTIENRQLGGSGTTGGLGALASLLGDLPSSGSGLGGSSSGFSFPTGFSIPSSFPNLGGSTGSGFSIPSSLPSLGGSTGFKRQLESSTENGVTQNQDCQELTLIFARGTGELGNMGTVAGPPLATKLQSLTNNKVTIQGVTYDASAAGDATMGADGGPTMASLVKQSLKQCPKSKVVLGGYSEGAMVVHNAANSLTADQVTAAVLFGDPLKMESVGKLSSDNVKEFCATGDPVCENGANVMAHLTYGNDATAAAQFLIKAAGISTSS